MTVEIPLTDDERAAVEDGQVALGRLLERLADTPTPGGLSPHELAGRSTAPKELPIVAVTHSGEHTRSS